MSDPRRRRRPGPGEWRFDGGTADADGPRAEEFVPEVVSSDGFPMLRGVVHRLGNHDTSGID